MQGAPRSEQFGDVYFSIQDGLAETRHVFLEGNGLPEAWRGRERFTIIETGFGTGLNFLAAWKLFEAAAAPAQRLEFISFEKYPLKASQIDEYLQPWAEELGASLPALLLAYPLTVPGFHAIQLTPRVNLLLIFDDVNAALPQLEARVDCWFLGGFRPASNPEMWSETVFREMARLSRPGTTLATFTVAGDVRRGLEAAGFAVEKVSGFGRKREMLKGRFIQAR